MLFAADSKMNLASIIIVSLSLIAIVNQPVRGDNRKEIENSSGAIDDASANVDSEFIRSYAARALQLEPIQNFIRDKGNDLDSTSASKQNQDDRLTDSPKTSARALLYPYSPNVAYGPAPPAQAPYSGNPQYAPVQSNAYPAPASNSYSSYDTFSSNQLPYEVIELTRPIVKVIGSKQVLQDGSKQTFIKKYIDFQDSKRVPPPSDFANFAGDLTNDKLEEEEEILERRKPFKGSKSDDIKGFKKDEIDLDVDEEKLLEGSSKKDADFDENDELVEVNVDPDKNARSFGKKRLLSSKLKLPLNDKKPEVDKGLDGPELPKAKDKLSKSELLRGKEDSEAKYDDKKSGDSHQKTSSESIKVPKSKVQ